MKDKVIIFGLGKDFKQHKDIILSKFEVIGCTDNFIVPEDDFCRNSYMLPDSIIEHNFDKVLICSRKYQDAIKIQLVKLKIPIFKIIYIESLYQNNSKSAFEEVLFDMELYKASNTEEKFSICDDSLHLIDADKYAEAGTPCQHYFAQDIWGANKIFHNNPKQHYDIGSRLDGFIAHLLVFREVNYIDIRPLPYKIPNLHFLQGDATSLIELKDETIESLSCFHAMEHFGLGRYGDEVKPSAYRKAAENMQRVVMNGGHLYLGVPIGPKDKLVFNAHRIFSISTILSLFDKMRLKELSVVEPDGMFAKPIELIDIQNLMEYSCGLFEFVK